jgi:MFS family permease
VAFVSMLKLASHWMPSRRYAFASGVALFVGVLGATLAGPPLRIAVDAFGWRAVMVASAAMTAAVAIAAWLVVRDDPAERGYASYHPQARAHAGGDSVVAQLREVLSYRNTWLLFVIPGAFSGVLLTFAGLWGVPFLVSQYGFSTRGAAVLTSAMLVCWSVASMAYGPISERLGRRKPVYVAGLVAMMALWSVLVLVPGLPVAALVALLIAISIAAGAFIVTFAYARESVPARLAGTVSGVANMGVMLGGMLMQPLVGLVLDARWTGRTVEGVRVYDFAAYQWGFALMLAWGAVSLALLAFARETHCKPMP